VLYQFKCAPDAGNPDSNLAIDANGVLYGTTAAGGTSTECGQGCGTAFALAPPVPPGNAWTETVLWSFGAKGDPAYPSGGVALGNGGVIYGSAQNGDLAGMVFSLTPPAAPGSPWTEAVLDNFPRTGTQYPTTAALYAGGVLYGATALHERNEQGGTVFALTPPASPGGPWTQETLWTFPPRGIHQTSNQPNGPLIADKKNGALFGATGNGISSTGTIFELLPPKQVGGAWTLRILNRSNTADPSLGLFSGGVLYGTDALNNAIWSLVP